MVGVVVAPADAEMEGPVLVLVVSEVDGGTSPRPEVASAMLGSLATLAQGRALKYMKTEVNNKSSEKGKGRSHLNATTIDRGILPNVSLQVQGGLRV